MWIANGGVCSSFKTYFGSVICVNNERNNFAIPFNAINSIDCFESMLRISNSRRREYRGFISFN